MVSESRVTSEAALIFVLPGVDVLPGGRALDGPADLVLGIVWGDFARTVLGWDPVVEVRSVPSYMSSSLMLERDATLGPACDVMRVPLSTLCRPASMSFMVPEFFRRMLFALAVFLRSADVVAVSGGLGGARGGVGATRLGGCGTAAGSSSLAGSCDASTSVGSGVSVDLRFSISEREYMFSLANVLESVGYGKLVLEAFAEPSEPLRSISGTTAILCDLDDCDDDDVLRSRDGRSRGRSASVSSSLEADERVLRDLELL